MKKLLVLTIILAVYTFSGCAGLGTEKKATLMPDQFKIEVDVNPQNDYAVHEMTGGLTWNLK